MSVGGWFRIDAVPGRKFAALILILTSFCATSPVHAVGGLTGAYCRFPYSLLKAADSPEKAEAIALYLNSNFPAGSRQDPSDSLYPPRRSDKDLSHADLLYRRRGLPPQLYPKDNDFTSTPEELFQATVEGMRAYVKAHGTQ